MQDQELSEIKLSQNDSNLVEILRNILTDEISLSFCNTYWLSTADLVFTLGTCTSSPQTSAEVLEKIS